MAGIIFLSLACLHALQSLDALFSSPHSWQTDPVQGRAKERSLSCEKVLPRCAWLVLSKTGPFFCTSLYIFQFCSWIESLIRRPPLLPGGCFCYPFIEFSSPLDLKKRTWQCSDFCEIQSSPPCLLVWATCASCASIFCPFSPKEEGTEGTTQTVKLIC